MNILSFNVRGLGKGVKWSAIRRLVRKHNLDLLCLQETKRFKVERKVTGRGFIMLEGTWLSEAQNVCIINVYAPCDSQNKRHLWGNPLGSKKYCAQMSYGV